MTAAEHVSQLGYTWQDDGVWITCSCGWERNLGFTPPLDEATRAWAEHLSDAADPVSS